MTDAHEKAFVEAIYNANEALAEHGLSDKERVKNAITAYLSALPQPEPVAWWTDIFETVGSGKMHRLILAADDCEPQEGWKPLYTSPPDTAALQARAEKAEAERDEWNAACMEASDGCNQRSQTIRSLRTHLEAAEAARDALAEAVRRAIQFIENGTDLGFIHMDNVAEDDPAQTALPALRTALEQHGPGK